MWFSVFTEDFICTRTDNLGGPTRNVSFILVSFWLWTNSHNKHSWDLHIYFVPKPIQARNSRVDNNLTTHNNSFLSHQEIFNETLCFQFFCRGLVFLSYLKMHVTSSAMLYQKDQCAFLVNSAYVLFCHVPTELHTFSIYSIFIYLYIFTITLAALLCCFFFTTHTDELPSLWFNIIDG